MALFWSPNSKLTISRQLFSRIGLINVTKFLAWFLFTLRIKKFWGIRYFHIWGTWCFYITNYIINLLWGRWYFHIINLLWKQFMCWLIIIRLNSLWKYTLQTDGREKFCKTDCHSFTQVWKYFDYKNLLIYGIPQNFFTQRVNKNHARNLVTLVRPILENSCLEIHNLLLGLQKRVMTIVALIIASSLLQIGNTNMDIWSGEPYTGCHTCYHPHQGCTWEGGREGGKGHLPPC